MNNVILTRSEFKGVLLGLGVLPATLFVLGLHLGSADSREQANAVVQDQDLAKLNQAPVIGEKVNVPQLLEADRQSTNETINYSDELSLLSEVVEVESMPVQAMLEPIMPVEVISDEPLHEVVDPPEQSFESPIQEPQLEANSLAQQPREKKAFVETYVIQVGRFSLKENAASYVKTLGQKGIHARLGSVNERVKGYPVEVGMFSSYSEAKARAAAMKRSDRIEGFVRQSAVSEASTSS